MDIKDRVVWITGASSGIGEALAHRIVLLGGKVILSARNEARLNQISHSIDNNRNTYVLPMDMEKTSDFSTALERAQKIWGTIDILINNAGVSQRSLVLETDQDIIKKIMATNYLGPAILTSLVLPIMKKQHHGHILFVSSVAGKFATPLRSTYAASKMALQGFSDSLRAEVYHHNISVTLVVPGFVRTHISINALEGNGQPHNVMDPNQDRGISPEKAAKIIISGMIKNKREITCGLVTKTRVALFLARFFPSLLAIIMRNAKVT